MKRGMFAVLIGSAMLLPTVGAAEEYSYGCGFEQPAYLVGGLQGQWNWSVDPIDALVNVQSYNAYSGKQALSVTSPWGLAIAYQPLKFPVNAGFRSTAAITADPPGRALFETRFAGFLRHHAVDQKGSLVTVDVGVMQAPLSGYGMLKPYMYAAFAEVYENDTLTAASYFVIDASMATQWHTYGIDYYTRGRAAQVLIDGVPVGAVPMWGRPLAWLSGISLVTEQAKSSSPSMRTTLFDELLLTNNRRG